MSEAEDIVQEALLRLHHAPISRPWSPGCASTSCDRLMYYGDRSQTATHQTSHVRLHTASDTPARPGKPGELQTEVSQPGLLSCLVGCR
jgi:hypothetical protein